jgi:hypothetical protein
MELCNARFLNVLVKYVPIFQKSFLKIAFHSISMDFVGFFYSFLVFGKSITK